MKLLSSIFDLQPIHISLIFIINIILLTSAFSSENLYFIHRVEAVDKIYKLNNKAPKKIEEIYSIKGNVSALPTILLTEDLIAYRLTNESLITIYNFKTGLVKKALLESKNCDYPFFLKNKPYIAVVCSPENIKKSKSDLREIKIINYNDDSLIKKFQGFKLTPTKDGKGLHSLSMIKNLNNYQMKISYFNISNDQLTLMKSIPLESESGLGRAHKPYNIVDLVSLDKDNYYYLAYDEHEYRYYDSSLKPFCQKSSDGDHKETSHAHKEQNNLAFSPNTKVAALTERNWNELTYIVIKDLNKNKIILTDYYGVLPMASNDEVFFFSESSLVNGKEKKFRQIKQFSLYSYSLQDGKLETLSQFQNNSIHWLDPLR